MRNRFNMALCVVLFLALTTGLFAQNVNREELEKNQATVNFINYEGPHSRIDTVEAIRMIGFDLGRAIKNGATRAGAGNRYFVIHCVGDVDGEKFDADVFGLGVDVGVDHIRNLRLIIQGYLQGAYDYSPSDAALLARFVTIYNAVFRGDWDFFNTRYKNIVVQNLERPKAGLSIRYDEWPGQTLMTIPLGTGRPGDLSAIDTSGLTDPGVIDSMRGDDGRGIEDRQGMVDLKEREADEANQSATLQRLAIEEEEKNLQREKEESALAQQRREREQAQQRQQEDQARRQQEDARRRQQEAQRQEEEARQKAEQARRDEEARRISQEESRRQQEEAAKQAELARQQAEQAKQLEQEARQLAGAAQQRQKELAQEQQTADQQQQERAQREQDLDQRRQEADQTEQFADQKTQEAQQERQQIAQDQQEMIDSGSNAGTTPGGTSIATAQGGARASGLLGAGIVQTNSSLGRLVRVDPNNGAIIQSSGMNTVNTRTVIFTGSRIFAIAGINQGNGAIRLVEINTDTLDMLKQGDDDIHPNSLLWTNGSNLYAIVVQDGKNYLARFDTNLTRQAQSDKEVSSFGSCLFQEDRVLTQSANGAPLVLNGQTLK